MQLCSGSQFDFQMFVYQLAQLWVSLLWECDSMNLGGQCFCWSAQIVLSVFVGQLRANINDQAPEMLTLHLALMLAGKGKRLTE